MNKNFHVLRRYGDFLAAASGPSAAKALGDTFWTPKKLILIGKNAKNAPKRGVAGETIKKTCAEKN